MSSSHRVRGSYLLGSWLHNNNVTCAEKKPNNSVSDVMLINSNTTLMETWAESSHPTSGHMTARAKAWLIRLHLFIFLVRQGHAAVTCSGIMKANSIKVNRNKQIIPLKH